MPQAGTGPRTAISRALESLNSLQRDASAGHLKAGPLFEAPKSLADSDRRLASLAQVKLRPPTESRREQALRAWEAWRQGKAEMPKAVLLRALCWEPEVVSDEAFGSCLRTLRPLRGRTIQALLPTYLRLWREGSDPEPYLNRALKKDLAALAKPHGVVALWRDASRQLLGPKAAGEFASGALRLRSSVREWLEHFNLASDTEFARSAASRLLKDAAASVRGPESLDWLFTYLFAHDAKTAGESGWGPALSSLILNDELVADERARERILDFSLGFLKLGDPRVSAVPWHAVGDEATHEVIRWRSSEDLRFFFDLVMKGKPDHQGRHRFWKRYVDGVTRSLIVLSESDERRLHRRLSDLQKRGRRFVRMTGTDLTSAFVMEFDRAIIVEFSEAGNACYVYQKEKEKNPIPWQSPTVDLHVLKNPRIVMSRLIHGQHWEHDFTNSLARRGIRPVSRRK